MPEGARMVDRSTAFGNPFRIGHPYHAAMFTGGDPWSFPLVQDASHAVTLYQRLLAQPDHARFVARIKRDLRGRDLCCWCPLDQPCHADVLLEIANPDLALAPPTDRRAG